MAFVKRNSFCFVGKIIINKSNAILSGNVAMFNCITMKNLKTSVINALRLSLITYSKWKAVVIGIVSNDLNRIKDAFRLKSSQHFCDWKNWIRIENVGFHPNHFQPLRNPVSILTVKLIEFSPKNMLKWPNFLRQILLYNYFNVISLIVILDDVSHNRIVTIIFVGIGKVF